MTKASGWSVITRHSYHAEVERQEFPREAEAVTAWHVARGLKDFRAGGFVLLVKDGKLIRGRALGLPEAEAEALVAELEAVEA